MTFDSRCPYCRLISPLPARYRDRRVVCPECGEEFLAEDEADIINAESSRPVGTKKPAPSTRNVLIGVGMLAFLGAVIFLASKSGSKPREWPYQFLQTKTESAGKFENVMDIYVFSGRLDKDELWAFCQERKAKNKASNFYLMVLFDSPENVRPPRWPIPAAFDGEEEPMRHIRAIYIYNRRNDFSEIRWYAKNAWESIPDRYHP